MEPWFLNFIILISPAKNKKRTSMHSNTIYFKDIFMLDLMESIKHVLHWREGLMNSSRLTYFFSTQNNLADYLKINMKNIPSCNSSEWPAPSRRMMNISTCISTAAQLNAAQVTSSWEEAWQQRQQLDGMFIGCLPPAALRGGLTVGL